MPKDNNIGAAGSKVRTVGPYTDEQLELIQDHVTECHELNLGDEHHNGFCEACANTYLAAQYAMERFFPAGESTAVREAKREVAQEQQRLEEAILAFSQVCFSPVFYMKDGRAHVTYAKEHGLIGFSDGATFLEAIKNAIEDAS